ncbi:Nucleoredoxin [Hondaea fermentalgiana]|uniref:Nucleoredoxin n=1 Tax=Hondaea fermentalgiana TaxID=2315210 RepID=A0A2R5GKL2_9STRA|nr:Nucleoredoxin [Hondaea fermentalgiana]|eukprot:GBG30268.1 Nucleoredoxin [Hondaea fermentalgiana]
MASEAAMEELFGPELLSHEGTVETKSVAKKVMAIYASSNTCPPCQTFTPMLSKLYKKLNEEGKELEIVFLSADKDEDDFNACFKKMPWLAIPFSDNERKQTLMRKLKLQYIPTLAMVDGETGEIYNTSAREAVSSDEEGENYPWLPPSLEDCLGDRFIDAEGNEKTLADLKDKYVTLYFSAHWCPPCRHFTPKFIELYKKLKAEGKPWEVIFVSSDRDAEAFKGYFSEMPWLALPYEDRASKEMLSSHFGIEGIPSAIMLDKDLSVLNKGLRGYVDADPEGKDFPWKPKPVLTLTQGAGDINELPSMVVLMEQESEGTQAQFETIFTQVAETHATMVKEEKKDPMQFLVAPPGDMLADRVRKLCGLDSSKDEVRTLCNGDMCMKLHASTAVILLDIPDNGGYYELEGELTQENIAQFHKRFVSGELKDSRKQLNA